ncbi:MAG: GNAT family N-acetyltransferase, partial [Halioglobus sp.]|nr:GNAT family N-acetyltransferase [Halioglobus sp.]
PGNEQTLFIWQVAVHEDARGSGLAGRMLNALLARPECGQVSQLQTTITPDNEGSFALFRSFAKRVNARFHEGPGFEKDTHFQGQHDSERLITIGPIPDTTAPRRALHSVS